MKGQLPVNNHSEYDKNLTKHDEMSTSEMDKRAESIKIEITTESNIINGDENMSVFPRSFRKEEISDINFDERIECNLHYLA